MKVGVILYHNNIFNIYDKKWIHKCLESIKYQTFKNFDILELNYGDDNNSLQNIINIDKNWLFWNKQFKNHALAMNFLLNTAFTTHNYDIIFNINLDDYYEHERFQIQIKNYHKYKFDICSSNFKILKQNGRFSIMDFSKKILFNNEINKYILNSINPICHPGVCYSKTFWKKYEDIQYFDEVPYEDLNLWKRCIDKNIKIIILPDILTIYRKHSNQITANS